MPCVDTHLLCVFFFVIDFQEWCGLDVFHFKLLFMSNAWSVTATQELAWAGSRHWAEVTAIGILEEEKELPSFISNVVYYFS